MKILSLKSVLLYQLGRALLGEAKADAICFNDFLYTSTKSDSASNTPSAQKITDWYEIPLKKKPYKRLNASPFLYVSALPQTLSASGCANLKADPSVSWQGSVDRLNQSRSNLKVKLTNKQSLCWSQTPSIETQLWLEFEIETQQAGWIAFSLTKNGLDRWLQHLCTHSSQSIASQQARKYPSFSQSTALDSLTDRLLWQAQYTYACCHHLESTQTHSASSTSKNSLSEQANREHRLWQDHPTGLSLVHALMDTSDSLFWIPYRWPTQQYLLLLKRVAPLCQTFERFYRACLCGSNPSDVGPSAPILAKPVQPSRLISATKNVLKVLLEQHLGEPAPEKL